MSRELVAREWSPRPGNGRNQPLLLKETMENTRFGEVAGGTTAECAAVCCCPCALVNLLVLALVKLPAGLCKRAYKKNRRKRRKKNKGTLGNGKEGMQGNGKDESELEEPSVSSSQEELLSSIPRNGSVIDEISVCTDEFWEQFMGKDHVGFWRNPSYKE
eukprot:Gb_40443 [translate_table: standard]